MQERTKQRPGSIAITDTIEQLITKGYTLEQAFQMKNEPYSKDIADNAICIMGAIREGKGLPQAILYCTSSQKKRRPEEVTESKELSVANISKIPKWAWVVGIGLLFLSGVFKK